MITPLKNHNETKRETISENVVSSWMLTNQSKYKLVKLPETTWLSLEHLAKDIQIDIPSS